MLIPQSDYICAGDGTIDLEELGTIFVSFGQELNDRQLQKVTLVSGIGSALSRHSRVHDFQFRVVAFDR